MIHAFRSGADIAPMCGLTRYDGDGGVNISYPNYVDDVTCVACRMAIDSSRRWIVGVDPAKQAETQEANALALAAGDALTPRQSADVAPGTRLGAADGSCMVGAPATASQGDAAIVRGYRLRRTRETGTTLELDLVVPSPSSEIVEAASKPFAQFEVSTSLSAPTPLDAITSEAALARALFVAENLDEIRKKAECDWTDCVLGCDECGLDDPCEKHAAIIVEREARVERVIDTMTADPNYAERWVDALDLASRTWAARRIGR